MTTTISRSSTRNPWIFTKCVATAYLSSVASIHTGLEQHLFACSACLRITWDLRDWKLSGRKTKECNILNISRRRNYSWGVLLGANWTGPFYSWKSEYTPTWNLVVWSWRKSLHPGKSHSLCGGPKPTFLVANLGRSIPSSAWVNASTSTKILSGLSLAYQIR